MGVNPSTHTGSSQYNQLTVLKQIKIGRKVKMLYIFQIWKKYSSGAGTAYPSGAPAFTPDF